MKLITLLNGNKMLVLKNDIGISSELSDTGVHEADSTEFIKTIIKPGMKILDIGSNLGYYAFLELRLVGRDGFVYAVEPVPANIACMQANIEMYDLMNIRVFQLALGAENTVARMRATKCSNSGTLMREGTSEWYETAFSNVYTEDIDVKQMSLDSFIEKYKIPIPDLIRMDTEGYEVEIIKGGQRTLEKMHKGNLLFIEIHSIIFDNPRESLTPMIDILYGKGFRPKRFNEETGFPKEKEGFITYLSECGYCPHVFFEKV